MTRTIRFNLVAALAAAVSVALGLAIGEARDHSIRSVDPVWAAPLHRVDDALAAGSPEEAVRALQDAYIAALGSRRWDGMVAVGDAARRVGLTTGAVRAYDARARQAYLVALFRARHDRSVEGVLRVADAFTALGDTEVAKQCRHLARPRISGIQIARNG